MAVITEHQATLGLAPVCQALGVPRASYYRWQPPEPEGPKIAVTSLWNSASTRSVKWASGSEIFFRDRFTGNGAFGCA